MSNVSYFVKNVVCVLLSLLIMKLNVLNVFGEVHLTDPTGWTNSDCDRKNWKDPSGWGVDYPKENLTRISNFNQNDTEQLHRKLVVCETSLTKCKEKTIVCDSKNDPQITQDSSMSNEQKQFNHLTDFIRRYVNLLLESANIPPVISKDMSGIVEVKVSARQLKLLRAFCDSISDISVRELDGILSDLLHKKDLHKHPEFSLWNKIQNILYQKQVWIVLGSGAIVMGFISLIMKRQSIASIVTISFIFIFIISFGIEYYKMYKEMDIEQMRILQQNPDTPSSCYSAKQSWFESLFAPFNFKDDECQKYLKAVSMDPLLQVSPVRVLSSIIADLFLHPAEKVGQAISHFSSAIFGNLPIQYSWFVFTFWSIVIIGVVCFCILLFSGASIHLGNFLFGVRISGQKQIHGVQPEIQLAVKNSEESQPAVKKSEELQPSNSSCNAAEALITSNASSYVLMDAQSLKVMLSTLMHHRNPVQELDKEPPKPVVETLSSELTSKSCSTDPGSIPGVLLEGTPETSSNKDEKTKTIDTKLGCEDLQPEPVLSKESDRNDFVFVENNAVLLQTSETVCTLGSGKEVLCTQDGKDDGTANS